MSRGPECTWINKFNFGLSVVFCTWHHWQVFLSHKKNLINSEQNCSSLSIVNLHPQLQHTRRAFDAGIPWRNCQYQYKHNPFEFQYFIIAQHPDHIDLSHLLRTVFVPHFHAYFCLRLPLNMFHGINLSLSLSPPLSLSISVSFPSGAMSWV